MISTAFSYINPFAKRELLENSEKEVTDIELVQAPFTWVDSIRNVLNVWEKLMLLNPNYNSGNIDGNTTKKVREFLHKNKLYDVKVFVNHYPVKEIFKRTFRNPHTSLASKIFFGTSNALVTAIFPFRLTGYRGDTFDVSSNSVFLFSNDPILAIDACADALYFCSKKNPTLFLSLFGIPVVNFPLLLKKTYNNFVSTRNFFKGKKEVKYVKETYKVLFPLYGLYISSIFVKDFFSVFSDILEKYNSNMFDLQYFEDYVLSQVTQKLFYSLSFLMLGHVIGNIFAYKQKHFAIEKECKKIKEEELPKNAPKTIFVDIGNSSEEIINI